MIYFIYELEHIGDHQRFIEKIGFTQGLSVGKIDESLLHRINMIPCMMIPEKVAFACKFANRTSGEISVVEGTPEYDQLDKNMLSEITAKGKYKYKLTDEDKYYAHLFEKCIMHYTLNKYYNNKIILNMATPSFFYEELGVEPLDLLMRKKTAMMEKIDACSNWDETQTLMHTNFGVQKFAEENELPFAIDL